MSSAPVWQSVGPAFWIRRCVAGSVLSLGVVCSGPLSVCAQILPGDCGYYKGRDDLLKGSRMTYAKELSRAFVKTADQAEVECFPTLQREWSCGGRLFDIKGFSSTQTSFFDDAGKVITPNEADARYKGKTVCDFSQPGVVFGVRTAEIWYEGSGAAFPLYMRTESRQVYTLSRP